MKERPILFSEPMVRAILDGSKTQTRRVVKRDVIADEFSTELPNGDIVETKSLCPYGQPGDRLWVRETHAWADKLVDGYEREDAINVAYKCDSQILCHEKDNVHDVSHESWNMNHPCLKWRPSIHMPRWASRITLEIFSVRVERLNHISEHDAILEGVTWRSCEDFEPVNILGPWGLCSGPARIAYKELWESINGPGSWAANPWVWVLTYKRV